MSLERFINQAISPWMSDSGPDADIVLSSRIRLARNITSYIFPTLAKADQLEEVIQLAAEHFDQQSLEGNLKFELIRIDEIEPLQKQVLIEKHLISPGLIEREKSAVLLSEDESVSIMINEEDHIRIQCLLPGFQLAEALNLSNKLDDWLEEKIDYAFDEKRGYLTSCPTNVGTGLRASVMMHLPAMVMTGQINRIIPAINQLGLVVRGIYGEGSEAQGNLFQISNQITLGKSEEDIVDDLQSVVLQLIQQERAARRHLLQASRIQVEDRVYRSFGTLAHSRIIETKEAASCLSDVRLGIDMGLIQNVPRNILNELMVLTQPGFLQQYAGERLSPGERDVRRAALIRERLRMEDDKADSIGG